MGYIFGGSTGETPESLQRKREVAEALLRRGATAMPQNLPEGMVAVAQALSGRIGLNALDKRAREGRAASDANWSKISKGWEGWGGGGDLAGTGGADTLAGSAGSDRVAKPFKVADPVAEDLAPHQRAFLNAVSGGESGGDYNVRYTPRGPAFFDDLSAHPGIMEDGPHGKTSAAGRYQFTKTTWDGMGGGDFSPANQDHRAWQLATRDYGARTGRDLDADLQANGLTAGIMEALTPTWQAFKGNRGRHAATYRDSLGRYTGSNTLPGGEGEDTLGGGGVIVGDGRPRVPMANGSAAPSGIRPFGVNPQSPDRRMPGGPVNPSLADAFPGAQPDPARFGGAAPKGNRLPQPGAMPPFDPMQASAPLNPVPPKGPMPHDDRNIPIAPMLGDEKPTARRQPVDQMQTAGIPEMQPPRGIVSPRAEDNGYTRGPGAAPGNLSPQKRVAAALMRRQADAGAPAAVGTGQAAPQAGSASAPAGDGANGPSMEQLMAALDDPYLSDGRRQMIGLMLRQKLDAADPSAKIALEKDRLELENLRNPADWQKLDDGRLYNERTGEIKEVPAAGGGGGFRFAGSSVEAQSLNRLIESGQLTPDQAAQLGAGKTVSGPNGEILFLTPQGVFGQPAGGGQPQPVNPGSRLLSPEPLGATAGAPAPAPSPAGAPTGGARPGMIPLTPPKTTVDERQAMTFADRLAASGQIIGDKESAGLSVKDNFVRNNDYIPDAIENWLVSDDYQALDQASRDFINAQLRRESGAVISPEEFDNAYKQYLPRPGDTVEVLKQKAANRKTVIEGMARAAGPTYRPGSDNDIPQGAVEMLQSNPSLADQFDAKYGKGAAARILGGR